VSTLEEIRKTVYDGKRVKTVELVQKAMEEGIAALDILNEGLVPGLRDCGDGYEKGVKFIPEMLQAAEAMKSSMKILKPHLGAAEGVSSGKVVLATIEGDVHDIGIELVSNMLDAAGFKIIFMGPDVPIDNIIATVKEEKPHLLGLSALLTNTMDLMPVVLQRLKQEGLRDKVKVMVGGAPVKQDFCDEIGADGWAYDAAGAVPVAKKLRAMLP
jgi:5-methyltetrahydrofolate--homocysteine methyltransferase